MSISSEDNNIRLWDVINWECILNISNINKEGVIYSGCFLNDENKNYIVTCNFNKIEKKNELIKLYDFEGNFAKTINNSNVGTFFIDTYYDDISSKNYIITSNVSCIRAYNYSENKIYHNYKEEKNNSNHYDVVINKNNNIIKLIESSGDENIRIWNFHSGKLLYKINLQKLSFGLSLLNDNYLFVGGNKEIYLLELKNGLIVKTLNGHNHYVNGIKKLIHPKYGECLISQNGWESQIKLWVIEKS